MVLDQQLVAEALDLTGLKTKKAVIEEALRTLTRSCADRTSLWVKGQGNRTAINPSVPYQSTA